MKTFQEILNTPAWDDAHRVWILESTDEQLDEYILHTTEKANEHLHLMALAERSRRQFNTLSKPHWSLPWTFWVTVAVLIVAILAWLFPRTVEKEMTPHSLNVYSNAATPQTNVTIQQPESLITKQTSPPAIYAEPKTNLPSVLKIQ